MKPAELERYLHEHIPLSRAMGVVVEAATLEQIVLRAPLAPNINHRETVFGGSACALCILAAWSLVHVRLQSAGVPARVVIQRNAMQYLRPVEGEFRARACIDSAPVWDQFLHVLARRQRARIEVVSTLEFAGEIAGRMTGSFVALIP